MSDDAETSKRAKRIRIGVLAGALVIVLVGGLLVMQSRGDRSEKFCYTSLAITTVHGKSVASRDQGESADGYCDLAKSGGVGQMPTLGYDCKVRDAKGKVVDSIAVPPDGNCGTDD